METISTTIEYLLDDPRFKEERPYAVHLLPGSKPTIPAGVLNTVQWVSIPTLIHDVRNHEPFSLSKNGFATFSARFSPFKSEQPTYSEVIRYQTETEAFLKTTVQAEKVICYDCRFRRNGPALRVGDIIDVNDPLLFDLPPRGAHNITAENGPQMIKKVLDAAGESKWLDRKYRYRIMNTWRPLVSKLDDRPLAFCDFQTVNKNDLVATDQIYSTLRTDLYYLKHNERQKWYWWSYQTPDEVLVMMMYDTRARPDEAKFCPHISFDNPKAAEDAPPRESVETRSIIVTLS
ncbi:hypothetical protein N0V90_001716 [Kalmusia sp. IMI 367209]|nr:hypothetical protein N0V90_001716 [Kalmusia sp. IMI 367209]